MPRRLIDGEAIWSSSKLANVQPEWVRPEYTWLYALAGANGSFELDTRAVWAKCYAFSRPDISIDKVQVVIAALVEAKLLFSWREAGKLWGFWTGSDKPGRLPRASWQKRSADNGMLCPYPPPDDLQEFLNDDALVERDSNTAEACVTHGESVPELELELEVEGELEPSSLKSSDVDSLSSLQVIKTIKKTSDPRHQLFVKSLNEYWMRFNPDLDLGMNGKIGKILKGVLKDNPSLTPERFTEWLVNRAESIEVNHAEPIDLWLHAVKKYSRGPLNKYGKPLAEVGNGKGAERQQQDFDAIEAAVERRRAGRLASATVESYESDVSQLEVNA